MSGTSWSWDPVRRKYYVYNQVEGLYIYEDGRRVDSSGRDVGSSTGAANPRQPPSASNTMQQLQHASGSSDLSSDLNRLNLRGENYPYQTANASYLSSSYQHPNQELAATLPSLYEEGPSKDITDPALASLNLLSRGRLRGGWREHEPLFPDFKIHKPGKKFFVLGKVIKVLWPELAGNYNTSVTVTPEAKTGEGIATKIRWFIVIRPGGPGARFCTCVPIQTYQGRGVAKPGVLKSQHAIAFTNRSEPAPQPNEKPSPGEGPMLPGIKIVPNKKTDKLDNMSRIDFARTYTVEHNVKVYDFGMVAKEYIERLKHQWIKVLLQDDLSSISRLGSGGGAGRDDSEEEGESEEDPYSKAHRTKSSRRRIPEEEEEEEEGEEEEEDEEEEEEDPRHRSSRYQDPGRHRKEKESQYSKHGKRRG